MEKRRNHVLHCIRRVVNSLATRAEPDQELLQRFVAQRDEAAFAVLVRRHGPMVLRVGLRTLQNEHDAEDVFQATFLVLSQKAQTVRRQESVASWLYGIAYRLALKTRAAAVQRKDRESRAPKKTTAATLAQITVQEAQAILDEELSRLPEKFRTPVVLCCLEGLARDEAAHQIGCSASVLKSRLEQARERLRQRLVTRGLTLPCGLGAFFLLEGASGATVPPALVFTTTKAAIMVAAGKAVTALVSANVTALTQGVIHGMSLGKLKSLTVALMTTSILCLVAGLVTYNVLAQDQVGAKQESIQALGPKSTTAQGNEATKSARIVFWRNGRLAGIRPEDKDSTWLSKALSTEGHIFSPYGHHLRVSPDGKHAAGGMREIQQQDTSIHKVFVRRLDTEDGQSVDLGVEGLCWCWSPDGGKLLVGSRHWPDPDKAPEISHWIVDVQTKEKTELKIPPGHTVTDWSPAGKQFLTMSRFQAKQVDGQRPTFETRINLVPNDVSETRIVVRSEDFGQDRATSFGRFSPDGRMALFTVWHVKEKPPTQQVFAIDLQEGKPRQISQELNAIIDGACWSPDGKQIAYVWHPANAEQEIETQLVITDLEGKNPRTLVTEKGRGLGLGALDWR